MLHRPLFPGTRPEETVRRSASGEVDLDRESIWISYCPMVVKGSGAYHLDPFASHHRLATPVSPLEAAQNRRWHSTYLDQAWLVHFLPRCQRNSRAERGTPAMLLNRSNGALEGTSTRDSLSLDSAPVDARAATGVPRDHRECRVPHRNRPTRGSWFTGALRCLLWDGRQSHWSGAPRSAGSVAHRRSRRST